MSCFNPGELMLLVESMARATLQRKPSNIPRFLFEYIAGIYQYRDLHNESNLAAMYNFEKIFSETQAQKEIEEKVQTRSKVSTDTPEVVQDHSRHVQLEKTVPKTANTKPLSKTQTHEASQRREVKISPPTTTIKTPTKSPGVANEPKPSLPTSSRIDPGFTKNAVTLSGATFNLDDSHSAPVPVNPKHLPTPPKQDNVKTTQRASNGPKPSEVQTLPITSPKESAVVPNRAQLEPGRPALASLDPIPPIGSPKESAVVPNTAQLEPGRPALAPADPKRLPTPPKQENIKTTQRAPNGPKPSEVQTLPITSPKESAVVSNRAQLEPGHPALAPLDPIPPIGSPKESAVVPNTAQLEPGRPALASLDPRPPIGSPKESAVVPNTAQLEPGRPALAPTDPKRLPTPPKQENIKTTQRAPNPFKADAPRRTAQKLPVASMNNAFRVPDIQKKHSQILPKAANAPQRALKQENIRTTQRAPNPFKADAPRRTAQKLPVASVYNAFRVPDIQKKHSQILPKAANAPQRALKQENIRTTQRAPNPFQADAPRRTAQKLPVASVYNAFRVPDIQKKHSQILPKAANAPQRALKQTKPKDLQTKTVALQETPVTHTDTPSTTVKAKAAPAPLAEATATQTSKRVRWSEWDKGRRKRADDMSAGIRDIFTPRPIPTNHFVPRQICATSYTCPHLAHTVHIIRHRDMARQ